MIINLAHDYYPTKCSSWDPYDNDELLMSSWNWLKSEFAFSFSLFFFSSASVSACHFCFSSLTNCLVSSDHSNFSHDWIAFLSYHFLSFLHSQFAPFHINFYQYLNLPLVVVITLTVYFIFIEFFHYFNGLIWMILQWNGFFKIFFQWNVSNLNWMKCIELNLVELYQSNQMQINNWIVLLN